jgi:hypothetical protein
MRAGGLALVVLMAAGVATPALADACTAALSGAPQIPAITEVVLSKQNKNIVFDLCLVSTSPSDGFDKPQVQVSIFGNDGALLGSGGNASVAPQDCTAQAVSGFPTFHRRSEATFNSQGDLTHVNPHVLVQMKWCKVGKPCDEATMEKALCVVKARIS